mgnify:FL=1
MIITFYDKDKHAFKEHRTVEMIRTERNKPLKIIYKGGYWNDFNKVKEMIVENDKLTITTDTFTTVVTDE